jgi:hypothetical protein
MLGELQRTQDEPNRITMLQFSNRQPEPSNQSGSGRSRQVGSPESALHQQIPKNLEITDGKRVLRSAIVGNRQLPNG